jgi:hypothetical protein
VLYVFESGPAQKRYTPRLTTTPRAPAKPLKPKLLRWALPPRELEVLSLLCERIKVRELAAAHLDQGLP